MVVVPAPVIVMVVPFVPLQVATFGSKLVNTTGLPEAPPVAETTNDRSPKTFAERALKLMV